MKAPCNRAAVRVFSIRQAIVIGPVPPRHRRDEPGDFGDRLEVDVADDAGLGSRHADVDHRRAGLDHVGGDHPGLPGGADDDVGLTTTAAMSAVRE